MAWEKTGATYLKTGDESGHLCSKCDCPMIINKIGKWTIYCPCCGKEIISKTVKYVATAPVYI